MARRNNHSKQKRRPRAARSSSCRCSPKRFDTAASSGSANIIHDEMKQGRRCSLRFSSTSAGRVPIVHSTGNACTPFPLAVYRPASLMAMLLVASLLPKNTFSLRWLVLSGGNCLGEVRSSIRSSSEKTFLQLNSNNANAMQSQSWLIDTETCLESSEEQNTNDGLILADRQIAMTLWNDFASSLENQAISIESSNMQRVEDNQEDWSSSIINSIPRGGGIDNDNNKSYSGLVNLGNTCYLNSQLQCAYHVPYLRQVVLSARDEMVEVEVEVEYEVEEEKKDDGTAIEEGDVTNCDDINDSEAPDNDSSEQTIGNDSEDCLSPTSNKKTVRRKEMRQEVQPISIALRSLQHTFGTLGGSSTSGSTNILCRALGINPYIQQDGQEFWKLFIPEVDYSKLTDLYSGYFDDYVREVTPVAENDNNTGTNPRERIRTEPFLDLSIPVAEGNVGSIETSLREMFTEPETLRVSEGNGWRPEKGADKVDALKGSSLKREGLPSLLQLHLKRFKYDWETGETSKINDCVAFPLELSLSNIISDVVEEEVVDDTVYDLQSIVIHRGEYGSGHYYSYVRPDIRSDDWYRFDDSQVTRVDYSEVVADAYGGRYRRKRRRSVDGNKASKRQRGLFSRIFSIGRSSSGGGSFGYGGRTSSAYMLQYARRSDIPTLYLENDK